MSVHLFFPPQWLPHMPYLSTPSLTAFLEENGIECQQHDLNLEAYDRLLSPDWLDLSGERVAGFLENLAENHHLRQNEVDRYEALANASIRHSVVRCHLEEAKRILRDPDDFYNFEKFNWASRILDEALAIHSAAHDPAQLSFLKFIGRTDPWNIDTLYDMAATPEGNPFHSFFEAEIIPRIEQCRPSLAGISIITQYQLIPAFTFLRQLRHRCPKLPIVVGGPFFSKLKDVVLRRSRLFDWIDVFVLGDGELPLLSLSQRVENTDDPTSIPDLDSIPNIIYRCSDGTVRATARKEPPEMDSLPTPSFRGLPLENYFSGEPVFPLLSSRGCYWRKCTFCGSFSIYGNRFRQRKPELVLQDMETLHHRHGATRFHFSDEALAPTRIEQVALGIRDRKLPFKWFGEARFENSFDDRHCRHLAEGGCIKLKFGLESGSQRVLDAMRKGTNLEVARRVIHSCHEAGIAMHFFCMVGFPTETDADVEQTLNFIQEHGEVVRSPGFSFYCSAFDLELSAEAFCNPSSLGITCIYRPPERELAVTFDFDSGRGRTRQELNRLVQRFIEEVSMMMAQPAAPNAEAHCFLYLSCFHGSLPKVSVQTPHESADPEPARDSVLQPAEDLSLKKLWTFFPQQRTEEGPDIRSAEPRFIRSVQTWRAAVGSNGHVLPLPPESVVLIHLCDGKRTWGDILDRWTAIQSASSAGGLESKSRLKLAHRLMAYLLQYGLVQIRAESNKDLKGTR